VTIGQAVNTWAYAGWIIATCLILLVAGIILYVGVLFYRRRWLDSSSGSTEPWTLDDLRRLRSQGDVTEDEYQAMRAAIIDSYRGMASPNKEGPPKTDNHGLGR